MIITDKNHLLKGCSEDFKSDFEWAQSVLEEHALDTHTRYMGMAYLLHRARTDLLMSIMLDNEKVKDEVIKSVKDQNDLSLEYRRIVTDSKQSEE